MWCSFNGTNILVNTEKGRQKYRNMSRRRAVTILAIDPDDDSRWPEVRGTVVGETEEGQRAIDELARLYLGVDKYPFHQEGDVRVLFKVAPMESAMPNFTRQPDLLRVSCAHGPRVGFMSCAPIKCLKVDLPCLLFDGEIFITCRSWPQKGADLVSLTLELESPIFPPVEQAFSMRTCGQSTGRSYL